MTDEEAPDAGGVDGQAKAVGGAWYNFFKFQIDIDARDNEVFSGTGGKTLDPSGDAFPIVWHEYVHYLQNIATTIGIRIFLNWVGLLVRFSKEVEKRTPLSVPLWRDNSNPLNAVYRQFLDEVTHLVALKAPLDKNPPKNVKAFEPYIDPANPSHAFLCVEHGAVRTGVPLGGNVFIEGMTQGVQWLIKGGGTWDKSFLDNRSIETTTVFYDAIIRYFAHYLPSENPCKLAVLLSHAALQTTQPAAFFFKLHAQGMPSAIPSLSASSFGSALLSDKHVKEGLKTAQAELDRFQRDNASKSGDDFFEMMLEMTRLMGKALTEYERGTAFAQILTPTSQALQDLAGEFGFPPLYTKDIDSAWTLGLSEPLRKLFMLFAAMNSLLDDADSNGFRDECPLLHKRYCTFPKNKKRYCHEHRLDFAEINNAVCLMGQASKLTSLYRKPLNVLP